MNNRRDTVLLDPLTAREMEILRLMADGLSNKEIADQLVIAPSTVRWYTKQIYAKLAVNSRTKVLIRARDLGLLVNDDDTRPTPTSVSPHTLTTPVRGVLSTPEARNRYYMLQNVRRFWVEGVLENSLHGAALVELGLKLETGAVSHPWDTLLRMPDVADQTLPPGTHIIEVFDKLNGKLLILGEPGSGKTTMLLELARDLLRRAETDDEHPIPVVFNLSSWSESRKPLAEWLTDELRIKYQAPKKVAQEWVTSDALLLLLDGLDEVAAGQRDVCVQAINAYREEHGFVDVVVCSRIRDYEGLTSYLKLNGAIVIQPLDIEQITHYLNTLGSDVVAVRDLITRDEQLRELAQSPLMLSIMVLAYRGVSGSDVPDFEDVEAQRKHLFDTYVQRMFEHRMGEKPCTEAETRYYLVWLAKQMQAHAYSVFHIEELQPDWLTEQQQGDYHRRVSLMLASLWALWLGGIYFLIASGIGASRVLSGLLLPLAGGIHGFNFTGNRWSKPIYPALSGVVYGTIMGTVIAGTYGTARALLFGITTIFNVIVLFYGFGRVMTAFGHGKDHVRLAEDLRFSRTHIKPLVGIIGLVVGCTIIITPRFVFGPDVVPATNFMAGIMVSAVLFSVSLLYFSGLTANTVESRQQPNQGIRTSFWNANRLAGLVLLLCILIGLFGMASVMPLITGISLGLVVGFAMFALTWVPFGGYTTIQHVALRSILYRDGSIPQNYARFLDYAASLILLRKVGGGYIFVHRTLLEYFAGLE